MKPTEADISLAKLNLMKYPTLHKVFNDFAEYSDASSTYFNRIFLLCMNHDNHELLTSLNQAIEYFEPRSHTQQRLVANDYERSTAASEELIVAFQIGQRIGFDKIEPEKPNEPSPDLMLTLENRQFCIELTSLNDQEYTVNRILANAFAQLKETISQKCQPPDFYLGLEVDTSRLPRASQRLDQTEVVNYLMNWIERLSICELIKTNGLIRFVDYWSFFSWKNDIFLSDLFNDPYLIVGREEIDKLKADPILTNWAKRIRIRDLEKSPFKSAIFQNNFGTQSIRIAQENSVLNIESGLITSSDNSSRLAASGFIERLKRAIDGKMKLKQCSSCSRIIIFMRANIRGRDFEKFSDEFEDVKDGLLEEMKQHKKLVGILLYSTSYQNGCFVQNPVADQDVKLSHKEAEILNIRE